MGLGSLLAIYLVWTFPLWIGDTAFTSFWNLVAGHRKRRRSRVAAEAGLGGPVVWPDEVDTWEEETGEGERTRVQARPVTAGYPGEDPDYAHATPMLRRVLLRIIGRA